MDRAASLELGPYRFHERLGEGGSGQVYRATGPSGEVAVKILGPAADLDDVARKRFAREIATLAKIEHPSLVRLLDHGIDDELGPYLVLPLLSGPTLRELVGGRALCPEAAVVLARPIAEAAAALHAAGYVHRDLKPENAIASAGAITVIDLGLAWREGMTQHTESGTAVGSIGYMAPEQVEGGNVGPAADVYAIGVMLHEWIAGRRPFARPRASEEAAATLVGNAPALASIDRRVDDALSALIARCLDGDPSRRPSAAELAAALASPGDTAVVIADPAGYQARIAADRAAALEGEARAALAGGRPFAALALCDRGLAYVPEHAGLQAIVADAERAPVATVAAPAAQRWRTLVPVLLSIAIGLAAIVAITWAALRERTPEPPPPQPVIETKKAGELTPENADLARGMMKMFDRALEERVNQPDAGAPVEAISPP